MDDTLHQSFHHPDRRFAPIAFYAINHFLEPDEIRWQVRQMATQGFGGFFFHPREGLRTPYFSEKYWEAMAAAIDAAEKADLQCWLYDEDPYPSGHAGGRVMLDHPEFAARLLVHGEFDVEGGKQVYVPLGGDRLLIVLARSEDGKQTVDVTGYAGWARHNWFRYYRRSKYYPGLPTPPDYHWRAGANEGACTLDWNAPPGRWKVFWFAEKNAFGDFPHGGLADLTNPEAVQYFIDLTHEVYLQRFGDKFGALIPGIFTDEPKPYGGWGKDFVKKFQALYGYDLRPMLPHLFHDLDDGTPQVRADYQRALLKFWIEAFWQPISDWCQEKGIAFTGHASPEEDPLGEVLYMSNLVPCLQRMQIPGTDLITTKRIGNRQNAIMNLSPKLVSSVAHQTGRERVLCESFGLTEWDVTLEDMRWMADWLLALGINLINPHMLMYSIDSFRKYEAPPSEFYQASYWRHYHLLADHITRLSQLFSGGEHVSHLALLRPHRSFITLLPTRRQEAESIRDQFMEIHQWLIENDYEFDQLDESMLQEADISDGVIHLDKETYKVLLIPPITAMEEASIPLIEQFLATGGKVVWIGASEVFVIDDAKREASPLAQNERLLSLPSWTEETARSLGEELDVSVPRTLWTDSPQVYSQHRRKDGRDLFFLFNTEATPAAATAYLSGIDALEQWDTDTGGACSIALTSGGRGSQFNLYLESHASALFVASAATQSVLPARQAKLRPVTQSDRSCYIDDWQASVLQDNVLILDRWNSRIDDAKVGTEQRWFDLSHRELEFGQLLTPEPAEKHWASRFVGDQPVDFDVWYANYFWVSEGVSRCRLVWESETIQGEHELWFNGVAVKDIRRERIYDTFNLAADIDGLIRHNATNDMVVRVRVRTRNDGLLEPLRVFGRFSVNLDTMQLDPPIMRLRSGSWTDQGLPHYAHDVAYEATFQIDPDPSGRRWVLDLGEVRDIAEVFVNEQTVGTRAWRPFLFDIADYVHAGDNHLRIVVTGNTSNLIYGARRASGLMQSARIATRQET